MVNEGFPKKTWFCQQKAIPIVKVKPIVALIFLLGLIPAMGQRTLGGMHGHLTVPDGNTFKKNSLAIGMVHYPGEYHYIVRKSSAGANTRGNKDEQFYFATVNFLPWMDISLVIGRIVEAEPWLNGIGDRSLNAKFQILKEKARMPSLAIALEAPFGNNSLLASNCLVATKKIDRFSITLGYGSPVVLQRKTANAAIGSNEYYGNFFDLRLKDKPNKYLSGVLLAIGYESRPNKKVSLYHNIEFDGNKINIGETVSYKNWDAYVFLANFDRLAIGISSRMDLK